MPAYKIPSLYLHGYLRDFSALIERYGLETKTYPKGSILTVPGVINNTSHYIHEGILHLSLSHSSGNERSLVFFGPQTIFPIGVVPHENLIDYEMILEAFTDITVSSFSYSMLRKIVTENGELAAQILEENCDFIGYLFYHDRNHSLEPTMIRVCDILYFYLACLSPEGNIIPMNQASLANLVGISLPQVERILKILREEGILDTSRGRVRVREIGKLRQHCSEQFQES